MTDRQTDGQGTTGADSSWTVHLSGAHGRKTIHVECVGVVRPAAHALVWETTPTWLAQTGTRSKRHHGCAPAIVWSAEARHASRNRDATCSRILHSRVSASIAHVWQRLVVISKKSRASKMLVQVINIRVRSVALRPWWLNTTGPPNWCRTSNGLIRGGLEPLFVTGLLPRMTGDALSWGVASRGYLSYRRCMLVGRVLCESWRWLPCKRRIERKSSPSGRWHHAWRRRHTVHCWPTERHSTGETHWRRALMRKHGHRSALVHTMHHWALRSVEARKASRWHTSQASRMLPERRHTRRWLHRCLVQRGGRWQWLLTGWLSSLLVPGLLHNCLWLDGALRCAGTSGRGRLAGGARRLGVCLLRRRSM